MKENELVLKAAKVLSTCPRERIPMIADIFKTYGIEIHDEYIQQFAEPQARKNGLKEKRADMDTSSWRQTDDKCALKLREAFTEGVSMTELSRRVGIHRVNLYKYLWGVRIATPKASSMIIQEIDKLLSGNGKAADTLSPDDDDWEI